LLSDGIFSHFDTFALFSNFEILAMAVHCVGCQVSQPAIILRKR
jgi:hypothetical protein